MGGADPLTQQLPISRCYTCRRASLCIAEACSPLCTPLSGVPRQPDSQAASPCAGQHARASLQPKKRQGTQAKRWCGGAQGSARIIGCFQRNREQLGFECKAALFDQEQQMAEDIDFLVPLKVLPVPLRCRSSCCAVQLVGCSYERGGER